jgi:hypothetical protein
MATPRKKKQPEDTPPAVPERATRCVQVQVGNVNVTLRRDAQTNAPLGATASFWGNGEHLAALAVEKVLRHAEVQYTKIQLDGESQRAVQAVEQARTKEAELQRQHQARVRGARRAHVPKTDRQAARHSAVTKAARDLFRSEPGRDWPRHALATIRKKAAAALRKHYPPDFDPADDLADNLIRTTMAEIAGTETPAQAKHRRKTAR